jgi:hypothetical protein
METNMTQKINLDRAAAAIVHQCALRESRSASNAASWLIKQAWQQRQQQNQTDATIAAHA